MPPDQGETEPAPVTARTRHQYEPFGTALTSVALVLRVKKRSKLEPSTGELKAGSAAIWNS